jgi:hypothetical protein
MLSSVLSVISITRYQPLLSTEGNWLKKPHIKTKILASIYPGVPNNAGTRGFMDYFFFSAFR